MRDDELRQPSLLKQVEKESNLQACELMLRLIRLGRERGGSYLWEFV